MKESIKRVHTFKLKVSVSQADIEEGECRKPSRCMEKLAVERALEKMFPNASGYRWMCVQHRIAKAALIQFDMKRTVSPHSYTLEAQRKSKIQATTSER